MCPRQRHSGRRVQQSKGAVRPLSEPRGHTSSGSHPRAHYNVEQPTSPKVRNFNPHSNLKIVFCRRYLRRKKGKNREIIGTSEPPVLCPPGIFKNLGVEKEPLLQEGLRRADTISDTSLFSRKTISPSRLPKMREAPFPAAGRGWRESSRALRKLPQEPGFASAPPALPKGR